MDKVHEIFEQLDQINYKKQGSLEWLEWRKKHIGASEVASIMGTCDFGNIYTLWLKKTGLVDKDVDNFATRRGQAFEAQIRAEYEAKYKVELSQDVLEFQDWPILSASLDGFYEQFGQKIVVEIKFPSRAKHNLAVQGVVPPNYVDQLQAQLLVTGANYAHYVSFDPEAEDTTRLAVVLVAPDYLRQKQILVEVKKFWECVETNTPPEGMKVQDDLIEDLDLLEKLQNEIKQRESLLETVETRLKSRMLASKVICKDWSLSWVERKGNIDYKLVPEIAGLDLEPYRKQGSRYLQIKKKKN